VPYPHASSLAQEIFESGIVPGDTDFRIFRDFGKVSGWFYKFVFLLFYYYKEFTYKISNPHVKFHTGVDFAWSKNGYVYHTKFDNVDQIPLGALQRTGDNILALTKGIVFEDHLADPSMQDTRGNLVFFDFLGAFMIRWPQYIASTVNIASLIIAGYSIYLNMQNARRSKNIQSLFRLNLQ